MGKPGDCLCWEDMTQRRTERNPGFPKRFVVKTTDLDPAEAESRINKALDILIDEALRIEAETRKGKRRV